MAPASQLCWAQSEFVLCGAAHHLTINHARSDLEMVHGPRDERPAPRPVITPSRDEPNAHGIAAKPSAGKPLRDRQGRPDYTVYIRAAPLTGLSSRTLRRRP